MLDRLNHHFARFTGVLHVLGMLAFFGMLGAFKGAMAFGVLWQIGLIEFRTFEWGMWGSAVLQIGYAVLDGEVDPRRREPGR